MSEGFMTNLFCQPTSGRATIVRRIPFARVSAMAFCLVFGSLSAPATASTYQIQLPAERTSSGPARPLSDRPADTAAAAMLEIRRRADLTWDELAEVFGVTRRSVHHWASGNAVNSKNELAIRQALAVVRRFDRGASADTRALLFTAIGGQTVLDLIRDGRFQDALARAPTTSVSETARLPLSTKAREARKPPAPALLVGAIQDRPDIPAKARLARAVRVPKAAG